MKPKILYIITQGRWGGAQKYVAELSRALGNEYDVSIACGESSAELFNAVRNTSANRIQLKYLVRAIRPLKDMRAFLAIARLLERGNFDIVHANSTKAGVLAALAHAWVRKQHAAHYNTRLIYTAHGWAFLEPLSWFARLLYTYMEQIAARARDATIVLSQKEKNAALAHKAAGVDSLYVIPNGIDCDALHFMDKNTARAELTHNKYIDARRLWIGTIANLYTTKGINILIAAAKILRQNLQQKNTSASIPYFFVIGDGPEHARLQTQIINARMEDMFFLVGARAEAAKFLKAFDIFVLPSLKEGFPYTVLEASCAEVPIIASNAGALTEIITHEENGLLVPTGDSRALADAILRFLKNPELSSLLKTNAHALADTFSLVQTLQKTKQVYQSMKKQLENCC